MDVDFLNIFVFFIKCFLNRFFISTIWSNISQRIFFEASFKCVFFKNNISSTLETWICFRKTPGYGFFKYFLKTTWTWRFSKKYFWVFYKIFVFSTTWMWRLLWNNFKAPFGSIFCREYFLKHHLNVYFLKNNTSSSSTMRAF